MRAIKVYLQAVGKVGTQNSQRDFEFSTAMSAKLTDEEMKNYYKVGNIFNMGIWYDARGRMHEDDLAKVVRTEILR